MLGYRQRKVIIDRNEIVLFTDGDINIEVELSPELETVWLTQKQMGELVAITLMIAESRPEEKDIMVNLVMNFLTM